MRKHFAEAYGNFSIKVARINGFHDPSTPPPQDLTIAYDVSKLTSVTAQLRDAKDAKVMCCTSMYCRVLHCQGTLLCQGTAKCRHLGRVQFRYTKVLPRYLTGHQV